MSLSPCPVPESWSQLVDHHKDSVVPMECEHRGEVDTWETMVMGHRNDMVDLSSSADERRCRGGHDTAVRDVKGDGMISEATPPTSLLQSRMFRKRASTKETSVDGTNLDELVMRVDGKSPPISVVIVDMGPG